MNRAARWTLFALAWCLLAWAALVIGDRQYARWIDETGKGDE